MNYTEDNIHEKPVIIIDEKPEIVPGQGEGETPVILIEDDGDDAPTVQQPRPRRRWPWVVGTAVVTGLLCLVAFLGYRYYRQYVNIGVPVTVTSEQNIQKLQAHHKAVTPEVVMTTDSILGVSMNFYQLCGLRAELTFTEPSSTDPDVYLYCRSSDYTSTNPKDNLYLGSLVVDGKEYPSDGTRLGYCAMANGNTVIGIARDEDVKDYCLEQGGSFFRQFILVSGGVLPAHFYLHGKVERCALGRMGDALYFIESCNKETMWDFADALREYGFVDAIYITGGTGNGLFYRDKDGKKHDNCAKATKNVKGKKAGIIPWLVFRK